MFYRIANDPANRRSKSQWKANNNPEQTAQTSSKQNLKNNPFTWISIDKVFFWRMSPA